MFAFLSRFPVPLVLDRESAFPNLLRREPLSLQAASVGHCGFPLALRSGHAIRTVFAKTVLQYHLG
jgi:hypothetical protein